MWGRRADTSSRVRGLDASGAHPADLAGAAAITTLRTAVTLAHHGDRALARELCASVLFEVQPIIRSRPELVRAILYALLMAHGFKLILRLCRALGSLQIHVELLPGRDGQVVPPRCYEDAKNITCELDPRWMSTLTPEDLLISRWCEALMSGPALACGVDARPSAPLNTEPV